MEYNALHYITYHQGELQCVLYFEVMDANTNDDHDAVWVGRKLIVPPTFAGRDCQRSQIFQDVSTSAVDRIFFITFTCNPNWCKIAVELEHEEIAQNRSDLLARIFT